MFTCTLGKKPTDAKYFLNDASEELVLLDTLRIASLKYKKVKSYMDVKKTLPKGNNFPSSVS